MSTGSKYQPQIDISIESQAWESEAQYRPLVERAITASLESGKLQLVVDSELSVVLTGDSRMQVINREWRGLDQPTNVLSFPGGDVAQGEIAGPILGDIIIAHETLTREAGEQGKLFEHHFTHLLVHGFLHLFGYDHETDNEALEMEGLETKILSGMGISDPYDTQELKDPGSES